MSSPPSYEYAPDPIEDVSAAGSPATWDPMVCDQLADLMSAASMADSVAFAELYDRTCARIYGVVLRVLRKADEAAQVVEHVYLEMWRTASEYDPARGSVLAWMATLAHRRAVERVRVATGVTSAQSPYPPETELSRFTPVWGGFPPNLTAPRPCGPSGPLTPRQHEVIVLIYLGGYTGRQVAALLNGTARRAASGGS